MGNAKLDELALETPIINTFDDIRVQATIFNKLSTTTMTKANRENNIGSDKWGDHQTKQISP